MRKLKCETYQQYQVLSADEKAALTGGLRPHQELADQYLWECRGSGVVKAWLQNATEAVRSHSAF